MIRATLDTNILVSAFLFSGNERRVLEAAIQGKFNLMTSPAILDELGRVLARLGAGEREAEGYIMRLMEASDVHHPKQREDAEVRDRGDAKIIECALSSASDYIVTGDDDLLSMREYRGTRIIKALELLNIINTK